MTARHKEALEEFRRNGIDTTNIPDNSRDTTIYVSPVAAGCITYKTAGDDVLHHTGFAFNVRVDPIHTMKIELGSKGEVYSGPLDITPSPLGNFAD